MAVDHYENFPVASFLLPKRLRQDVVNIYHFARSADDIADEGSQTNAQRLEALAAYRAHLWACQPGHPPETHAHDESLEAIFSPLARTIARHQLPLTPFEDLLSAFEQDIVQTRYRDQASLDDYCKHSANPVGRLMLHLYGAHTEHNLAYSDSICTALQRVNFLQDVAIDWQKQRVYLPQDLLERYAVSEAMIAQGDCGPAWKALMQDQVSSCRALLHFGQPLGRILSGRLGLELRMIIQGGLRILEKIELVQFDVFRQRPILHKKDWGLILWRTLRT